METKSLSSVQQAFKSKASMDSRIFLPNIDLDEELGHFVSQIERNTFSILSIRQKLSMMKKNGADFEEEAKAKINMFEQQIASIDRQVLGKFEAFHSRIDQMEQLAFQPYLFHPTRSVVISNTHMISSVYYSPEFLYIGTDTSKILVYNTKNLQLFQELGPFDDLPILQIGIVIHGEDPLFAIITPFKVLRVCSPQRPSYIKTFNTDKFCTWPSNLNSQFCLAIGTDDGTRLFHKDLLSYEDIRFQALLMAGGQDTIVLVSQSEAIVYSTEGKPQESQRFQLNAPPKLLTVSRSFFCIACDEYISLFHFDGAQTIVSTSTITQFLFSYELYFFRISDEMVVEVHDSFMKRHVSMIGSRSWSPHESQKAPAAVCIADATFVTAKDCKCVIWT